MNHRVRRVEVELLRQGPRHNQLLSPLTDYLAICGDFPGGVVNVPYEQSDAQNLLDDLRYTVSSTESSERLTNVRDRAGAQLATMLDAVPGPRWDPRDRPLELGVAHPPSPRHVGGRTRPAAVRDVEGSGRAPAVSVTTGCCCSPTARCASPATSVASRVRTTWPLAPRILYVTGDDVPFDEHLDVFERLLEPFRTDQLEPMEDQPRHWTSEHLTVIERATLDEIRDIATRAALQPRPRARPRCRDRDAPVGAIRAVTRRPGRDGR